MPTNRSLRRVCIISAVFLGSISRTAGQSAPLSFEVAAIKPSAPTPGPQDRTALNSHGRFTSTGLSVTALLQIAYGIQGYQVSGGPRWAYEDRYDISAKTEENATGEQIWSMVQTLLADRFHLQVHREMKELPVYGLVVAKGGTKMTESAADAQYSWRVGRGQWRVSRVEVRRLAGSLTREVGRTVVDLTGLTGRNDFTLEWNADEGVDSDGPSIFLALEQQLGLRLEARKHPTEMLIVDHVERPSEN